MRTGTTTAALHADHATRTARGTAMRTGTHDHGSAPPAGRAARTRPGMSPTRIVQIEQDILAQERCATPRATGACFADRGIFALNLVSSPGSGKTTLLVRTHRGAARAASPVAVIEGDQQTSLDADRIRATGAPRRADQHRQGLPPRRAHGRARARAGSQPADGSLLLIENVGNLVCPAAFDLGEAHKVVILSVTEGEDKPLKYPDMFHAADLMLLNKIDLLPYVTFDVGAAIEYARRVRPGPRR